MAFPENPVIGQLYSPCTVDDKTVWVYTGTRWDLIVDDTWVDLTDDEILDVISRMMQNPKASMVDFGRAIETAFKEKNDGR